jgi:hypothetical protein
VPNAAPALHPKEVLMELLVETRHGLHAVAELVVAGPQYATSQDIRLRATPGGFGTVASPDIRVSGSTLITERGNFPLTGTIAEVAEAAGLTPRSLSDVYSDTAVLAAGDTLRIDEAAAARLLRAFELGDAALRRLAPDDVPVLWPEHFDIGISLGEVNYGVSPGDAAIPEPYAYVGPWAERSGPFWNRPFGAAVLLADLDGVVDVYNFFVQGRSEALVGT